MSKEMTALKFYFRNGETWTINPPPHRRSLDQTNHNKFWTDQRQ